MKVYIQVNDRFEEKVLGSDYFDGGPYFHKEFCMWMFNEPTKNNEGKYITINCKEINVDQFRELFSVDDNKNYYKYLDELMKGKLITLELYSELQQR